MDPDIQNFPAKTASATAEPSFTDFLLADADWNDALVEAINDRPRDAPRDIDF